MIEAEKLCEEGDIFLSKIVILKGTIFFLSGDYEKAKKEYESAFKISSSNGNRPEEIKAIANLAIIKDHYGEIYKAREDFELAIKMAEEV